MAASFLPLSRRVEHRVVAGLVDSRDHGLAVDVTAVDDDQLGIQVDVDGRDAGHRLNLFGDRDAAVLAAHIGDAITKMRVAAVRGVRRLRDTGYPLGCGLMARSVTPPRGI